jgi:hypothetical protein
VAPRPAPTSETLVCLNLDWMLSVRGGIEHRFHPHLGVKGDLGVSVMGLLAAMTSFGGSILFGFHLTENVLMDIRLGAGFPLFFEAGKETIRDVNFPLDLWPDLTISVDF